MSEELLALSPAAPVRRRTTSRTSSRRERRSARFERWRERRIYRLTLRLERRRGRLATRRERFVRAGHRGGLLSRVRRRWLEGSERLEVLEELLLIRWNRFLLHVSANWERLPGPASRGGAAAAAGVSLTLAFAMVVMLPLRNATRTASGPTPIVLPDTGAEIAPRREASAPSTSAANPSTAVGTWEEHANPDLGHRFSYPSDWDIDESSGATVLSDPADQVVIEFLRAPPGRLTTASDQLVEQVTAPFSGFATLATETARTEQGYPSTSVGGTARDAVGTSIQLVVTTIRGPDGNHGIVVRFPASDPGDLDAVVEVIASFRLV